MKETNPNHRVNHFPPSSMSQPDDEPTFFERERDRLARETTSVNMLIARRVSLLICYVTGLRRVALINQWLE